MSGLRNSDSFCRFQMPSCPESLLFGRVSKACPTQSGTRDLPRFFCHLSVLFALCYLCKSYPPSTFPIPQLLSYPPTYSPTHKPASFALTTLKRSPSQRVTKSSPPLVLPPRPSSSDPFSATKMVLYVSYARASHAIWRLHLHTFSPSR